MCLQINERFVLSIQGTDSPTGLGYLTRESD
ncbi:MAG: hypothetical protein ACJA10_000520 [Oleispira sp.]|jgi:hypothetical protein